jgi:hypothetical protein
MTPRAAPQWIPVPPPAVRHPVFARLWSLMSSNEPAEIRRHRDEFLAGLSGRVIEVGAGSNFAHYPPKVEQVMVVEPEPYLRHGLAPRRRAQTFQSRSLTALLTVSLPRIAR